MFRFKVTVRFISSLTSESNVTAVRCSPDVKHDTLIPIPKKSTTKVLNDHRPVALTSLVMKAMERLIKNHITMVTDWLMDPLRFAYQAGRGVKDAKIFILDTIYKHQGTPDTAARLLFADFSSNHAATHSSWESHHLLSTWPPTHPVDHRLSYRLLVRGKRECWLTTPSLKIFFTSANCPQGCVLSPFVFILYTDDCMSTTWWNLLTAHSSCLCFQVPHSTTAQLWRIL